MNHVADSGHDDFYHARLQRPPAERGQGMAEIDRLERRACEHGEGEG